MARAESLTATQVYTYNGDGLLVAQSLDGVETAFTWDQALAIPQVLATSDSMRSVYGLGRLAVEQGDQWYYPQGDALGSVRQWTDALAAVLAVQSYSPYGELRSGLAVAPWGFTGERHDPTGLVYLRARWYNAALGRFLQMDPEPGYLEVPSAQHPYSYAANNPLRYRDPSGEIDPLDIVFLGLDAEALRQDYLALRREGWTRANTVSTAIDVLAAGIDIALLAVPGLGGGGHIGGQALKWALQGAGGGQLVWQGARAAAKVPGWVRAGQAGLKSGQIANRAIQGYMAARGGGESGSGDSCGPADASGSHDSAGTGFKAGSGPAPANQVQPPGPGWTWKGSGPPASGRGSWVNSATKESLHPHLGPSSHGPHWDYVDSFNTKFRWFLDGRLEPKSKP